MKLMKRFPGGTLLVPMFLSALIHTVFPNLFMIGGVTEAFFSGSSLNFILGSATFISGCSLKLSSVKNVVKRYGVLLISRTLICAVAGVAFYKLFGLNGFLGISLVAFVAVISSVNPSLFLAIMEDCGDETDKSAFGLVSVFSTPVIPMLIFSLTQPTAVDFMPIVSMLIPLIIGVVLGNLDQELGKFVSSGMPFIILVLGWSVGSKINLLEAVKASLSGVLMAILYYVLTTLPLFAIERKLMKRVGLSSIALSTMAGLSASVPFILARTNPQVTPYAGRAAAIVTFGVVVTAIVSPFLSKKLAKRQS